MMQTMHENAEQVRHVPVLPLETLAALAPRAGGRYLDGTLGMGGHASAVLASAPDIELCGLDRDEDALELAKQRLATFGARTHLFHCRYSGFADALGQLGWSKVDGALLDIGVSSLQLDEAGRGFSFYGDGPLDMRMDQSSGQPSAWHWVNRESFDKLKDCIATLGEEPQAGRIARAIVDARQKDAIDTTAQLANLVEKAYPAAWRAKARRHPATRTFQALRMAVNDELGELQRFLDQILAYLPVGGRLAVITFHSLEDRMVKQAMRHWAEGCRCARHIPRCVCGHQPEVRILHKKPVQAGSDELAVNPRASSAKLRAVEKIAEASGS
ncbi:16S rRNA (cytosine(1402)-N(4))-methyltransferase RsmH [Desulfovibrio intestinalis]|uniref:Ribosomal RNA small subunit methyltransferase H n=1 Tax=Desulfovibrio intestinalis TaxID=58621 RepID=A0A7W8C361_9BACT|nr:16S rRNA (cytosine(1402)-N(4))-methyltransferase RsmH [Desulfovibrio intestinalis]MBB5142860.1 16S rRNA (cytosine1402-N4)-methyltransferase [Desulfovibrio intestinalis]